MEVVKSISVIFHSFVIENSVFDYKFGTCCDEYQIQWVILFCDNKKNDIYINGVGPSGVF